MRVHYLQHVVFEGLGSIEAVLRDRGHSLGSTHLYAGQDLPSIEAFDWLIIMGGPMGIYDETAHPWLGAEKAFIKQAIEAGKVVLGICLGAQLIADALGARVVKNAYREIGWFNIERTQAVENTVLSAAIPQQAEVFHWHGDSFEIPPGAVALAESAACKNQAFVFEDRVVAFQFHLETTFETAGALIENCRDELDGSRYVQSEDELLSDKQRFSSINQIMLEVLNVLESRCLNTAIQRRQAQ